jgi:hypothetical protein
MSDHALQDPDRVRLDMYQLGKSVRALLTALAARWTSRIEADSSIDWEDGEAGKECRS